MWRLTSFSSKNTSKADRRSDEKESTAVKNCLCPHQVSVTCHRVKLTSRICEWLNVRRYDQKYDYQRQSRVIFHFIIYVRRSSPKSRYVCPKRIPYQNKNHNKHLQRRDHIPSQLRPFRNRIIGSIYPAPLSREFATKQFLETEEVGSHASGGAELDKEAVGVFGFLIIWGAEEIIGNWTICVSPRVPPQQKKIG